VGYIVAPERIIPDLVLVSMANVVVPVGIAQEAAVVALELGDDEVARAVAECSTVLIDPDLMHLTH
jgi:N-succinyldiaminopimelate aminotransferase